MKQRSLILLTIMIQAASAATAEFVLMSTTDRQNNRRLRYAVDLDHLNQTPSWKIGEEIPLEKEQLLAVIHDQYPELTNDAICGIELKRSLRAGGITTSRGKEHEGGASHRTAGRIDR